jgi:hypothetical protein
LAKNENSYNIYNSDSCTKLLNLVEYDQKTYFSFVQQNASFGKIISQKFSQTQHPSVKPKNRQWCILRPKLMLKPKFIIISHQICCNLHQNIFLEFNSEGLSP